MDSEEKEIIVGLSDIKRHTVEIGELGTKVETLTDRVSKVESKMDTIDIIKDDIKVIKESLSKKFLSTPLGIWCTKASVIIGAIVLFALVSAAVGLNIMEYLAKLPK